MVVQWVAQLAPNGKEVLGLIGLQVLPVSVWVLCACCDFLPCTVGKLVTQNDANALFLSLLAV